VPVKLKAFDLQGGSIIAEEAEAGTITEKYTEMGDTETHSYSPSNVGRIYNGDQNVPSAEAKSARAEEKGNARASRKSDAAIHNVKATTAKAIQFEEVREKIIRISEDRGIDHRSLMRMFDSESIVGENGGETKSGSKSSAVTKDNEIDAQPLLTPKDFKNRLLQLGFKISDITTEGPDNDFSVLAGDDSLLSADEFKAIFEMEMETQDLYETQKEEKPEDDLTFAPAPSEIEGTMWVKIVEARDLNLPSGWFDKSTAQKRSTLLNLNILPSDLEPPLSQKVLKMIQNPASIEEHADDETSSAKASGRDDEPEASEEDTAAKTSDESNDNENALDIVQNNNSGVPRLNYQLTPAFGLTHYEPCHGYELVELDERSRRSSNFGGVEDGHSTKREDYENPQSAGGQDSATNGTTKEDKMNKSKVGGFALKKHKSSRLQRLEEKRRSRFAKMKSNLRELEIKSRADTTLDQDMRYIDVVKLTGPGMSANLSMEEYAEITSHKKIGQKKRRVAKRAYRHVVQKPMTSQERKDLYKDTRQFLRGKLLTRVFTVINILENVNVAQMHDPRNVDGASLSGLIEQNLNVCRQEPLIPGLTIKDENAPDGFNISHSYWEYRTASNPSANEENYLVVDGKKRRMVDGFMYRYLGKRLDESSKLAAVDGTTRCVYRAEAVDDSKNDDEDGGGERGEQGDNGKVGDGNNTTTHKKLKRVITKRQLDLFSVDPGDTVIWQRCMRLKGLENTMSKAELESRHLKAWFTKFDNNNSLTLDQHEFGNALKEMGFKLSRNEVQTLMERFDREGDGEIDYREFAGWVTAEDKGPVGFGFRDIGTLLREVHDIARRTPQDTLQETPFLPAKKVDKAEEEMSEEERAAKKEGENADDADKNTDSGTDSTPEVAQVAEEKLYWPLSGDAESLSQFREMINARTPNETVRVKIPKREKTNNLSTAGTTAAAEKENEEEENEEKSGNNEKTTAGSGDNATPNDDSNEDRFVMRPVWRERFTKSELKRICGVFYQGNMAALANEAFIKFTQLPPDELESHQVQTLSSTQIPKQVDPLNTDQEMQMVRRGLVSMATTPGKLTDVNVRKAYFTFMSKLQTNAMLNVDTFVDFMIDVDFPVDWGYGEELNGGAVQNDDEDEEEEEDEQEGKKADEEEKKEEKKEEDGEKKKDDADDEPQSVEHGSDPEGATRRKSLREALPLRIKLRMLMDQHHIWGTVTCADVAKLMKGDVVQELENKLRYLLMRKALATDGMSHWLVDIALSLDRQKIKIYARDPESSDVMKLTLEENTSNVRALADYLLTDEDLRRRGLRTVRHRSRKETTKMTDKRHQTATKIVNHGKDHLLAAKRLKDMCSQDRLAPVFVDALFHEGRACEAIAKRVLVSRDPHTGEKRLKIGEEYEFVVALRDAFAESEFDFFVNVDFEYLTFKVEHEPTKSDVFLTDQSHGVKDAIGAKNIATSPDEAPTANRARKRMVLDAIRSKSKLCAFLSGVSSVLGVVFESADGNSNDEISWTDFLGHLASKRNPYFTLQLLPDNLHENEEPYAGHTVFHRTPADRDGGQAPWFDKPFSVHYKPTTKKKGTFSYFCNLCFQLWTKTIDI
jgi:hypothetical protein